MKLIAVATLSLLVGCGSSSDDLADARIGAIDGTTSNAPTAGIYVTTAGSVLVFPLEATGDTSPARVISGAATGLATSIGIAVDHTGAIFIANRTGGNVTVYAPGVTGNVAPTKTLTATGMGSPESLAFDASGNLFVATCPGCGSANGGDTGIFHFTSGATTSDYNIEGSNTGFTNPAVAITSAGTIVVANSFGGNVQTFAADAMGNATPATTFTPTGSSNIQSVAATPNVIAVADPSAGVQLYAPTSTGNATPAATIASSDKFTLSYPGGMFIDTSATQPVLYLVDYSAGAVYVITTTGTGADLAVGSVRTISGPTTDLLNPLDIFVVH